MPLHPQVRALPWAPTRLSLETLPELRRATVEATPTEAGLGPPLARVEDLLADGVRCRLYRPRDELLPVCVYLHGGGWVEGGLETHDTLCRLLAEQSSAAVLAVDYRLAPEHPYPAACDDVDRAIDWLRAAGGQHELDGARTAVAGDSAGGHLAAVAAHRWRDRGVTLAGQVLFYPAIDPTEAHWGTAEHPGLQRQGMRWCWDAFAPADTDRGHPDVAPQRADLTGLPPTLVITAEYDILTGEAEEYAAALAEAGVSCVTAQYRGQVHGFVRRVARFDAAPLAISQAAAFLRGHLCDPTGEGSA